MEAASRTAKLWVPTPRSLEVRSEYMPAIQGMARLLVREGRDDHRLGPLLEEVAMRGDSVWRDWAALEQARLHQ